MKIRASIQTISLVLLGIFLFWGKGFSQSIERVEPPNWWAGMKNPELQLLVYGKDIAHLKPSIDYRGVTIRQVVRVPNDNYLFIDLLLNKPAAGAFSINFSDEEQVVLTHRYELLQREAGSAERQGFDQSDVLYLITPDRFANGDPGNDAVDGMLEKPNRAFKGGRHGGDIEGIRKNLDYIKDMGYTAIWLNPVLENDMPDYSYHGYATTDFYKVDSRYGSNASYRQLSQEAQSKGIQLIMDMIVNHCGSKHWWMEDPPTADWINFSDKYVETNHRKTVIQDPYAAEVDRTTFTDGWFVPTMPDLNQRNPLMATYLTQASIWWIEYGDLAGIRMDTYPYPDMEYMADWTRKVMAEYPNFNIVGEEWYEPQPAIVAYWQKGKENPNGYRSELKSLMDFPLRAALSTALNAEEDWSSGWINLYELLALDFLYAAPEELVTFPDNHDMPRFFAQIGEDFNLFQLGIAFILTTRGVPQIYYGTEILMSSPAQRDDGLIRSDFPGGWAGDTISGFTGRGLTERQKAAQDFMKKLLRWRQKTPAVHQGALTHFLPQDGVYVYFRHDGDEKVMVVLNKNKEAYRLKTRPLPGDTSAGIYRKGCFDRERSFVGNRIGVGPPAAPDFGSDGTELTRSRSLGFFPDHGLAALDKAQKAPVNCIIHDAEIIRDEKGFELQLPGFQQVADQGGGVKGQLGIEEPDVERIAGGG